MKDLRIASPCPADWNRMTGDDRVRHCAECDLNVYNFAAMTSAEVEDLIANREGRLCLRLYQRRDGTFLTKDCPAEFKVKVRRISRIAGAALAGAMTVAGAAAQAPVPNKPSIATQQKGILRLLITDQTGAVISHAQIRILDSAGHEILAASASNNGMLETTLPLGKYSIDVSSPGFRKFREILTMAHDEFVTIHFKADMTMIQGGDMFSSFQPVEPESSDISLTRIEPRPNTPIPATPQKRSNEK